MSIKIYDGLRISISDIEKFTKIFDKRCLDFLKDQTLRLMNTVKPELVLQSAEMAKGFRGNQSAKSILKDPVAEQYFKYLEVAKLYTKAIKGRWNYINPECWFNAFPYNKHFYIIPGYPTGLKYPKYPEYVEEFFYWNNTDEPDNISYKEFQKRGKLWEKSGALDTPIRNRLSHELIQYDPIECSLLLIEKRVLECEKLNNEKNFCPASYVAMIRLEKEEEDEHNRSKNS